MTALRTFSALRLWVLAWFVASMGVAIASPLVHPQAFEVICSGTGAIKLLVQTDDGTVETVSYTHLTLPTTPYV